jgi:lysophospholipase L1-like esterase
MMRTTVRKALGGALVASTFFLAAEAGLRVAYREDELLLAWERVDGELTTDPRSGMLTLRRNTLVVRGDGAYQWQAPLNGQALRATADWPRARRPGTPRWLLLGDSWAYGISTRQEATLATRLESSLARSLAVTRVEVVNAGVPGASAWDVRARWHALADQIEVDGVVLKIPANRGSPALRDARRSQGPPPPGYLLRGLRRAVLGLAALRDDPWRVDSVPTGEDHDEILALIEEIRQRGLPVVALVTPRDRAEATRHAQARGTADEKTTAVSQRWEHWSRALEPTGAWIAGHTLPERSCFGYVDHAHPSERGAVVLAETVASRVALARWWPALAYEPRCSDVQGVTAPTNADP